MRIYIGFFLVVLFCSTSVKAQDVYIDISANHIFNRVELSSSQKVMSNTNRRNWDYQFIIWSPVRPNFRSISGNRFEQISGDFLPNDILLWQLESMGGTNATNIQGTLPGYKYFTTSNQTWFEPPSTSLGGGFSRGDIIFNFKIPSDKYEGNTFHAGDYLITVTQNYDFAPSSFETTLKVPAAIQWRTNIFSKTFTINSLDQYRFTSGSISDILEEFEIGNTVNFNLWAKASSSLIQFTSSKGVQGSRDISTIQLGSASPKLNSLPLSSNWQNYSSSNFEVKTGNRNNFTLQLYLSANDFKTHFFEAGTYTFQLNLDAISTDNTVSSIQNTDITIKVNPLSEIMIPSSGQTVDFNFNTASDYQQGKSKVIPDQIKLSNNENFELYVKSGTNFFKKYGVQSDINSNILEVGIDGISSVPLLNNPQKIISAGAPVLDGELDIKYNISPTAAQSLVGKEKTTYSIDVIYSFTAL